MSGRRSRLEIIFDILKAINSGHKKPTPVMYQSNLSWDRCEEYLSHLEDQGLIRWVDNPERDNRTPQILELLPRGKRLLEDLYKLDKFMEEIQKED